MNLTPELYLKFAKDVEPEIFEDKTPKFHLEIIRFIDSEGQYKAIAVFRGAGKTTLLNKIYVLSRLYFAAEPFIMIVSANEDKATAFLEAIKGSIDKAAAKGYAIARGKAWNKGFIEVIINQGMKDEVGKISEAVPKAGFFKMSKMKQFIAFDDELNITNKDPDDAFSYLAGGELYANTFAAGAAYAIGRISNINYTSIFLPFFVDEISSMMELNEDFVLFALMPMQIIFYKSADEKRRGYEKFDEIS